MIVEGPKMTLPLSFVGLRLENNSKENVTVKTVQTIFFFFLLYPCSRAHGSRGSLLVLMPSIIGFTLLQHKHTRPLEVKWLQKDLWEVKIRCRFWCAHDLFCSNVGVLRNYFHKLARNSVLCSHKFMHMAVMKSCSRRSGHSSPATPQTG